MCSAPAANKISAHLSAAQPFTSPDGSKPPRTRSHAERSACYAETELAPEDPRNPFDESENDSDDHSGDRDIAHVSFGSSAGPLAPIMKGHDVGSSLVPSRKAAGGRNNRSLVPRNNDAGALQEQFQRLLDPNVFARFAAPRALNNFCDRLPTIERLEAEGLYTLVDPAVKLVSEVSEDISEGVSQILSPRPKEPSSAQLRISNGEESSVIVPHSFDQAGKSVLKKTESDHLKDNRYLDFADPLADV